MSLPIPANTKCQIYHAGTAPPADPASFDVPCVLKADFAKAQDSRDSPGTGIIWTHTLLVAKGVDIRDGYQGDNTANPLMADLVVIPEIAGTQFIVTFVELVLRGTPSEHKRAYLDRQPPTWPTDEL